MYKLIISDLDGTLLNENHEISAYTKKIVEEVTQKGIHFFIATGRHHYDVFEKKKELGLSNAYTISCNGGRVHGPSGELLFSHDIDDKVANEILSLELDQEILFSVFTHDMIYIFDESDWVHYEGKDYPVEFADKKSFVAKSPIKWFYYCDSHEKLLKLDEIIKNSWGEYVDTMFSLETCLEIMPKNISKGYAIEEIAKLEGIDTKDIIAFGDGFNDLEMLSVVGKGCIMENASEKLKKALPKNEIIGKNTDDAVANYLKKLYL